MKFYSIFLLILLSLLSYSQDGCENKESGVYSRPGLMKIKKNVRRFKLIDMGGVSTHSPEQFIISHRNFSFTKIETKTPKVRYIHNAISGVMKIKCWANNDTSKDHLKITAGGNILLSEDFGEYNQFELNFHFGEARTIIIEVYNKGIKGCSPGAFQCTLKTWYYKEIYGYQRQMITYKLH